MRAALAFAPLLLLSLLLSACGPEEAALPDTEEAALLIGATCRFDGARATPEDGSDPVHRLVPIDVRFFGLAKPTFKVVAYSEATPLDGRAVAGSTSYDRGRAVWTPLRGFPEDAVVAWKAVACGKSIGGSFKTGALWKPVAQMAVYADAPMFIDMRNATWLSPEPTNAAVLTKLLAPMLWFKVQAIDERSASALVAAVGHDASGNVRVEPLTRPTEVGINTKRNPYAEVEPFSVRLRFDDGVHTGSMTLKDAALTLGFADRKIADARFIADLDVTNLLIDGAPACDVLAAYSTETCGPCTSAPLDTSRCFTLVMTDVSGTAIAPQPWR